MKRGLMLNTRHNAHAMLLAMQHGIHRIYPEHPHFRSLLRGAFLGKKLSAQEGHAQQEAAAVQAAGALADAEQQCAALQQELARRPAQEEMQALRQRVEALRLLVDSREEEADATGERFGAICSYLVCT